MAIIGYAAALEQFHPTELLHYCQLAERHGFGGVMAADHFQPWVPQQGHNAFVWSWMAALGATIERLLTGDVAHHDDGKYYKMARVRMWTVPKEPPPIYVATAGPIAAKWAGAHCDGFITPGAGVEKLKMLLGKFGEGARSAGKDPKRMPKLLQLHMSWATT